MKKLSISCPKCQRTKVKKIPLQGDCMYVAEEFDCDSEVFDAPVTGYTCQDPKCKTTFYISQSS